MGSPAGDSACGKGGGESRSLGSGGSLGWAECYCFQVVHVSPSTCRHEFSQIPLNLFENADSLFRRSTFTQHSAWRQRGGDCSDRGLGWLRNSPLRRWMVSRFSRTFGATSDWSFSGRFP